MKRISTGHGPLRTGLLLLLVALLLALGGCKRSEVAQIGPILDEWRYDPSSSGANTIEYELVETTDFSETLGFKVTSLPNSASYTLDHIFLIDGWYAQLEFTTSDERKLVLRVAPAEGYSPLTTTYTETHGTPGESYSFGGIEVETRTASSKGCSIASWQRGGFQYLMHSSQRYGMPTGEDISAMAQDFTVEPAAVLSSSATGG